MVTGPRFSPSGCCTTRDAATTTVYEIDHGSSRDPLAQFPGRELLVYSLISQHGVCFNLTQDWAARMLSLTCNTPDKFRALNYHRSTIFGHEPSMWSHEFSHSSIFQLLLTVGSLFGLQNARAMVAAVDSYLYPESPHCWDPGQLLILSVAVLQGSLHTSPVKSFRHLLHNATSLLMGVLACL